MTKPKRDYNPSKAHQDAMGWNDPIEEAIGNRATGREETSDPEQTPETNSPRTLRDVPDQPLNQKEMLSLEELNRQTEERLQEPTVNIATPKSPIPPQKTIKDVLAETIPTPVSRLDRLLVTKTSSPESPPQEIEIKAKELPPLNMENELLAQQEKRMKQELTFPAEDIELTVLRKYILEDGFVLATVSFHIVSLCAQPMTTPSTTTWDFADRAMIPDMVLALLNQPGYLEGIWPSLRIVMGSNKGNAAWTAGIATTIAFFDCIRTLPALKELQNNS